MQLQGITIATSVLSVQVLQIHQIWSIISTDSNEVIEGVTLTSDIWQEN